MEARPTTTYADVRRLIRDGDNALFRNGGAIAATQVGDYTHVGKFRWLRDTRGKATVLMIGECREFFGGRIVTASSQIRKYPGRIDVYRPKCSQECAAKSADLVCRQAGHQYGWRSVLLALWLRCNLLRLIARLFGAGKIDTSDTTLSTWDDSKHCSQTVGWAERIAGKGEDFDPCPKVGDRFIQPIDLARGYHSILWEGLEL
jgi:hypothetical protein